MRERSWTIRADLRSMLAAEVTALLVAAATVAAGKSLWAGLIGGAVLGIALFVVRVTRLSPWRWATIAIHRVRHREHRIPTWGAP